MSGSTRFAFDDALSFITAGARGGDSEYTVPSKLERTSVLWKKLLSDLLLPCKKDISGRSAESSEFFPTSLNEHPETMLPRGVPPLSYNLTASASIPSNLEEKITTPVGPAVLFNVEPSDCSPRLNALYSFKNSQLENTKSSMLSLDSTAYSSPSNVQPAKCIRLVTFATVPNNSIKAYPLVCPV